MPEGWEFKCIRQTSRRYLWAANHPGGLPSQGGVSRTPQAARKAAAAAAQAASQAS